MIPLRNELSNKLVAYSIYEQLTNHLIQGLLQRSSAVAPFYGKKFFRKWVKSGCKNTLLGILHYRTVKESFIQLLIHHINNRKQCCGSGSGILDPVPF
jgi:hypothetical protein